MVRNTSVYGDILNRIVSIDATCSSYEMNSTCQKYLSSFVVDSACLGSESVIISEAEQLCLGDIPVFSVILFMLPERFLRQFFGRRLFF